MRWRLGLRPRPSWGSLRRSPNPLVGMSFAPSALTTRYFLAPHFLLAQIYPPQFNIPRIVNGSKQPPEPTPSTLCSSFPDLLDLNCRGPLTYFLVIRPLYRPTQYTDIGLQSYIHTYIGLHT